MKCHYEVLGLPISCSSDELKKSYRKLALEWHPDKNLDRLEEATEVFQLIQQAYEILIDPQERAWYDRHRDDILRGDLESNYKDSCLNVYQYFNSNCFKGYNDDEKGFYTVYRNVFNNVTAEDNPFMDEEIYVPEFGFSNSSYDKVVHNFYAYWQSYCTFKSYSWVDKFDLSEARKSGAGRQVIRLMEKENKKMRDQHKKIRNEEIRELVSFVRKRDKRVHVHRKLLEEEKAEKAKRMEEQRRKQIQERNKTLENYQEHAWSSMSQFEEHFNEIETNLDDTFGAAGANGSINTEEDDVIEDLYCVACDKDFRSLKSMKNHENSKKHKGNVAFLKVTMNNDELENEVIGEVNVTSDNDEPSNNSSLEEDISSEALLEELIKSSAKSKKKKKKKVAQYDIEEMISDRNACDINLKFNEMQMSCESGKDIPSCDVKMSATEPNVEKSVHVKKKGKKVKPKTECYEFAAENDLDPDEKPSTICGTCKQDFSSRNKLFDHLKKTGHAVLKNDHPRTQNAADSVEKKQRKIKR